MSVEPKGCVCRVLRFDNAGRTSLQLLALIFSTLAGVTLVLTTIAMYGLASFEVRRRREEITARLALGATQIADRSL